MAKRVIALVLIFLAASAAWGVLGGITQFRTMETYSQLEGAVGELWGTAHTQVAPEISAVFPRGEVPAGVLSNAARGANDRLLAVDEATGSTDAAALVRVPVQLASTDLRTRLDLDYRRKGLLWFSTYGVDFDGWWTAVNPFPESRDFVIAFRFPTPEAIYDSFSFVVNGRETEVRATADGALEATLPLAPAEEVAFGVTYRSRGLDSWTYQFGPEVTQVRDFDLQIETDFKDIDFPSRTISPTSRDETPQGWRLLWHHDNLVSGFQVGLATPHRLNPGPLAAKMTFFAPISLLFFFFVIFVLGILRGVNLHPMHYFFLAAAFFAFHLLFSYLVDHLDVNLAFAIAALTSVGLVVSYLRLVAGRRFAFGEAGLAQLLYLVLFSYTHFLKGFTGLTVTVGAVLTLFVLMQATAKVDWDRVFNGRGNPPGIGTVGHGAGAGGEGSGRT